ncbi:MAG: hypothetical protein ABI388_11905 [Bacteroidia bacterium]
MIPKTNLHQLIQSLTKSEKRYFSLFAKRHVIAGENKYIKLFNCIEKQKTYNEIKIKQILKYKETYTNLAVEKGYLKELILKSLKHFHEKNFIDSILYDKLIQIEILYEKGLFEMGYELIDKSILLAQKHEKFLIHTQLLIWKINYGAKLNTFDSIFSDSDAASKNIALFLEVLTYKKGFHELFLIANKTQEVKNTKQIKQIISQLKPIYKLPTPHSNLGAHYYFSILSFIAVLENNNQNMLLYFEQDLAIFKNNFIFCKEEPNLYLNAANNFIFSLIISDELKKAEDEIILLQNTTNALNLTIQQKARTFINISDNRLLLLSKQNKLTLAQEVAKEIEKDLLLYEKYIDQPRKTFLYFSFASTHFFCKNHKLVNKFLNRIIKTKEDKEADTSLISLAMIAQLINMIEGDELVLFKNKLNTTRKYIKMQSSSDWLLLFCDFISVNEKNKANKFKAENELKNKLITSAKNNATLKKLLGYFDLIKWLEGK